MLCLAALAAIGSLFRIQDQNSTNRLAKAKSEYLQAAMHQNVDWNEWSAEVFKNARIQKKLILLDLGAFWSHACKQMDRDNYNDADIVDFINQNFVPIKVDVEEHPELERRFSILAKMSSTEYVDEYPIIAVLTPEGKLLYATGPKMKNSFHDSLANLLDIWSKDQAAQIAGAQKFEEQIANDPSMLPTPGIASHAQINHALQLLSVSYDSQNGGFIELNHTKYLHPAGLQFLLTQAYKNKNQKAKNIVLETLDRLLKTPVYDPIYGGFFRGSYDAAWTKPRFEKLLSENSEMFKIYAEAFSLTKKHSYREAAYEIFNFLKNSLWDEKDGAFCSSQNGEGTKDEDGSFHTWTSSQFNDLTLSRNESKIAELCLGLSNFTTPSVNDQEKLSPHLTLSTKEAAAHLDITETEADADYQSVKIKLIEARKKNSPPINKAIFTNSNGAAISALVVGYRVFGDRSMFEMAKSAMRCLRTRLQHPDGGFYHSLEQDKPEGIGWLDDTAYTLNAAIDLYSLTGDPTLLRDSQEWSQYCLSKFEDPSSGGFYDLKGVNNDAGVTLNLYKPFQDSPLPGANVVLCEAFDKLAGLSSPSLRLHAQRILDSAAGSIEIFKMDNLAYCSALDNHLSPPTTVTLFGDPNEKSFQSLVQTASENLTIFSNLYILNTHRIVSPDVAQIVNFNKKKILVYSPAEMKKVFSSAGEVQVDRNKK